MVGHECVGSAEYHHVSSVTSSFRKQRKYVTEVKAY